MPRKKLLILGGTGEAAELAHMIPEKLRSDMDVVISYSGITGHQPDLPGTVRVGGFGGAEGLISYMEQEDFNWVIDATHPFAAKISQMCYVAALATKTQRVSLIRPEWQPFPNDRWLQVQNMAEAAKVVEDLAGTTLLTIGKKELPAFEGVEGVHFVVRMVKEPENDLGLSDYEVVVGHPPFSVEEECTLLKDKKIRLLVTKNSGGLKTREKIEAARQEKISVVMIQRPIPEPGDQVSSVTHALGWLLNHGA